MNHKKPQTILSVLENVSILLMMFSLKHLSDDEEHYHEDASDNGLIRNGNSKKRISTGKDGVVRVLPPVSAAEIHAVEKERKARRNHLISGIPGTSEKISWNGTMQKKFGIVSHIRIEEVTAGFADEVIYSLFAKQSEDLDLLHEDLEQIDDMDIEEIDLNWLIAMIAI
ncbi:hypothetical protein Tco_0951123 [Tanacetum coccineum]|uniref:Uncharacterized protein n=1 Tax=Tanacetum coccineum TaxID=301880 RepID=A0ABQ5DUY7_9ASTR